MHRRYAMIITLTLSAASLVAIMILYSCQGEYRDTSSGQQLSTQPGAKAPASLKSLDDPANPYRTQYGEWDRWLFAHEVGISRGMQNGYVLNRPKGTVVTFTFVDDQGWMLPQIEYTRLHEEALKAGTSQAFGKENCYVYAVGAMDTQLYAKVHQENRLVEAAYYSRIPDWLVARPPNAACLLPNGDVITDGALGSGAEAENPGSAGQDGCGGCGGAKSEEVIWYRFDQDGKPLGASREFWFALYYDVDVLGWPEGSCDRRYDGYLIFRDSMTDELLSVYDYEGTKLDVAEEPPIRDAHPFRMLRPSELRELYAAQLELGM